MSVSSQDVFGQDVSSVGLSSQELPPAFRAGEPAIAAAASARRSLSAQDAVDIWIARWLGIRRKHLLARYACDPRRLYEIWEETRHPGSRAKAREAFAAKFPTLVDRIDYGPHRRVPRRPPPDLQPGLFDGIEAG